MLMIQRQLQGSSPVNKVGAYQRAAAAAAGARRHAHRQKIAIGPASDVVISCAIEFGSAIAAVPT